MRPIRRFLAIMLPQVVAKTAFSFAPTSLVPLRRRAFPQRVTHNGGKHDAFHPLQSSWSVLQLLHQKDFTTISIGATESPSKLNSGTSSSANSSPATSDKKRNNKPRQHVNPLARHHQVPRLSSDDPRWYKEAFENESPANGVWLDVGCCKGGFLREIKKKMDEEEGEEFNFLGVEIRAEVAEMAQDRLKRMMASSPQSPKNIHFTPMNINVDLRTLLSHVNQFSRVSVITINFPDPLFKVKHKKRRVVTNKFCSDLWEGCKDGTTIYLQSDIQDVVDDMRLTFREQGGFEDLVGDNLETYFFEGSRSGFDQFKGVKTERETSVMNNGGNVWKCSLRVTKK